MFQSEKAVCWDFKTATTGAAPLMEHPQLDKILLRLREVGVASILTATDEALASPESRFFDLIVPSSQIVDRGQRDYSRIPGLMGLSLGEAVRKIAVVDNHPLAGIRHNQPGLVIVKADQERADPRLIVQTLLSLSKKGSGNFSLGFSVIRNRSGIIPTPPYAARRCLSKEIPVVFNLQDGPSVGNRFVISNISDNPDYQRALDAGEIAEDVELSIPIGKPRKRVSAYSPYLPEE